MSARPSTYLTDGISDILTVGGTADFLRKVRRGSGSAGMLGPVD